MRNQYFPLLALLISGLVTGCAPRSLNAGAESVHLSDYMVPKSCKFVGNIMNSNVHGDLYLESSIADLQKDDINFLKNEGAKLGANIVVLTSHISHETKIKTYGKTPRSITVNEHSVIAKAYRCSSAFAPSSGKSSNTHVKISETPLI